MRRLILGIAVSVLAILFIPYIIIPVHASEPPLTEVFSNLGFTNITNTTIETFRAGPYDITLYAEFAGFHEENELSFYEVGTSIFNLIFNGSEGGSGYISPPLTKIFTADSDFGISMLTPENHTYYTETSRNPDYPEQHAIIYENLDEPEMFLIGFENLYATHTDRDYNDMVLSLKLQTPQHVIPEVPFGTILSFISMFIAFVGFLGFKRFRPWQNR